MTGKKTLIRISQVVVGLTVLLVVAVLAVIYFLDRTNGTMVSSGEERHYLLHVPASYDRTKPTPLVISMHALAMWPAAQMETTHWNELADEYGFIVVYPAGTGLIRIWRMHEPAPEIGLMEDVRFISELIDRLKSDYNIDPARIYANGFSNGGAMASVLSCALSSRIAAVASVAPAQDALVPWSWFRDCPPVPMMQFHGTADPFVPYRGGLSFPTPRPFPDVSSWAANWARRNRCRPDPIERRVATDVSRREYTNCAADAPVVLYTVMGGGHTWPGGKPLPEWWAGPTSHSIDATRLIWAFFREHRLPPTS